MVIKSSSLPIAGFVNSQVVSLLLVGIFSLSFVVYNIMLNSTEGESSLLDAAEP